MKYVTFLIMHKYCNKCKQNKSVTEFHKCSSSKDGLQNNCISCRQISNRIYVNNNKEKVYAKAYEWASKNKSKRKNTVLKSKYGLTIEEYNSKLKIQNNSCAICNTHQNKLKRSLMVDHNHSTGIVRDLLCDRCNRVLGFIKEDITLSNNIINYIKKHTKV